MTLSQTLCDSKHSPIPNPPFPTDRLKGVTLMAEAERRRENTSACVQVSEARWFILGWKFPRTPSVHQNSQECIGAAQRWGTRPASPGRAGEVLNSSFSGALDLENPALSLLLKVNVQGTKSPAKRRSLHPQTILYIIPTRRCDTVPTIHVRIFNRPAPRFCLIGCVQALNFRNWSGKLAARRPDA